MTSEATLAATEPPVKRPRFSRSLLGWILILGTAILLFAVLPPETIPGLVPYSKFRGYVERRQLSLITVESQADSYILIGTPINSNAQEQELSEKVATRVPTSALDGYGWNTFLALARDGGTDVEFKPAGNNFLRPVLLNVGPWLLLIFLVWFLFLRRIRVVNRQPQESLRQ